jgi:Cu+-exporting ATPase
MKMQPAKVSLPVIGLSLGGCGALTLERVLARLDGVLRVYVNPAMETAYVDYDPGRITADEIAKTIRKLGYEIAVPRRSRL